MIQHQTTSKTVQTRFPGIALMENLLALALLSILAGGFMFHQTRLTQRVHQIRHYNTVLYAALTKSELCHLHTNQQYELSVNPKTKFSLSRYYIKQQVVNRNCLKPGFIQQ